MLVYQHETDEPASSKSWQGRDELRWVLPTGKAMRTRQIAERAPVLCHSCARGSRRLERHDRAKLLPPSDTSARIAARGLLAIQRQLSSKQLSVKLRTRIRDLNKAILGDDESIIRNSHLVHSCTLRILARAQLPESSYLKRECQCAPQCIAVPEFLHQHIDA